MDTDATKISHSDALFTVEEKSHPPIIIKLKLNEQVTEMELDTGAAMSLISESTQKSLFPDITLRPTKVTLHTYTSEVVPVKGELDVHAKYEQQSCYLSLLIVHRSGPSIEIGCQRFGSIGLTSNVRSVRMRNFGLFNKYPEVFKDEMGTMVNFKATLYLKPKARPKFSGQGQCPLHFGIALKLSWHVLKMLTLYPRSVTVIGQAPLLLSQKRWQITLLQ